MSRPRIAPVAGAVLVGVAAFVVRYLTSGALENDHFVMLARAQRVLLGDLPVRDFEDPGQPLAYLVSTAAAWAFGSTLLVNVVLCLVFLAVTAAVTYWLAARATASPAAGVLAAAVTIALAPRMYNTTKVVVPVVAIWLAWRYADLPRTRRLAALAAWSAVAFLLRHDYLVYVTAASGLLLVMCHAGTPRVAAERVAVYTALVALGVAPWLLYVQWYEGVPAYLASALRFVAAEGRRTADAGVPALFYACVAVPVVGLATAFRPGPRLSAAQVASASVLVLFIDVVFLRDVLAARLPDVVAPMAVAMAVIVGQVWPPRVAQRVAVLLLAVGLASAGIAALRRPAGVPTPARVWRQAVRVTHRLEVASADIQPNPGLAPLVAYLERCTRPDERVLVSGFGPEIPVLSHRRFASGLASWIPGYCTDPADVTRAAARLDRESLGAAVMLDGSTVFMRGWPDLGRRVAERLHEHDVPAISGRLRVWLPAAADQAPLDLPTGLPCAARSAVPGAPPGTTVGSTPIGSATIGTTTIGTATISATSPATDPTVVAGG